VAEKEQYLASPPKVKVENTIGSGDSAVAGFVYGGGCRQELQRSSDLCGGCRHRNHVKAWHSALSTR